MSRSSEWALRVQAEEDAEIEQLHTDINMMIEELRKPIRMPSFGETLEAVRLADEQN